MTLQNKMKKYMITMMLLAGCFSIAAAQSATINKFSDTVTYGNYKIYPEKVVQLLYGSNPTKDFAFVFLGTWTHPTNTLEASKSKGTVLITKVYKQQGKFYANGKLQNTRGLEPKKIIIDIEGAIDFKEINNN